MEENQNQQNDIGIQLEPEVKVKTKLQPDDWLCIVCNKKITSDKDKFEYNNQSEFQFVNPGGYYFDIITFSAADGCRDLGDPTDEFTWFPGHSWSFAVCNRCSNHLGWKYQGEFSFYGLIKSRLIKGAALFN
ncbi:cereblon family protein [Bacteroidota bacterium]